MGLAPIIGAALTAAGGVATNAKNVQLSKKSYRWQRKQNKVRYQVAMKDMRKAGLNPILAYKQGGSMPGSGSNIPMQNPLASAAQAGSAVGSLKLAKVHTAAQIANLEAQTALGVEKINTEKTMQSQASSVAGLNAARTETEKWNTAYRDEQITNLIIEGGILADNASVSSANAVLARLDEQIYKSGVFKAQRWLVKLGLTPSNAKKVMDLRKAKK